MDASDPPEPPPADTHNSSEPPADVPNQPEPPKKTGGAVKKRKRSLLYKTKKGSNNQKTFGRVNATINLFRPRFDSIQLVIEAMGGGGNITINGVEGGQGREDTTINWWRTRHQGLRWTWKIRMRRKTQQLFRSTSKQGYCQFGRG
jgi:hypothetical protein